MGMSIDKVIGVQLRILRWMPDDLSTLHWRLVLYQLSMNNLIAPAAGQ